MNDIKFRTIESFTPKGDQPAVIESISRGLGGNQKFQSIKGATGTGKTYVLAKIIEQVQRPALVICHNKTLAAQLYKEFSLFFPDNAVSYFVSYYDYYQPEAYVAARDLYIEKDSSINEEIDKMRLKATATLMERRDVVIVASVSCIYGLGSPMDYQRMHLDLHPGAPVSRETIIRKLIEIHYERNDNVLESGSFRVRGDVIDVYPPYAKNPFRIELFGDEVEALTERDSLNNTIISSKPRLFIYPAKHFVMPHERVQDAAKYIEQELTERCAYFEKEGKIIEKERIYSRTKYDIEMLLTLGYCGGIENYSRHLSGRSEGQPPATLLDYFPEDFITFIDESHVTVSQIGGMYNGDRSRKQSLVDYGFRLPSALDNRPLYTEEFFTKTGPVVFVSATPGDFELDKSSQISELIIRPTGLLDPVIEVRGTEGQIDDLLSEINKTVSEGNRVLVTTLTKKMSEDLTAYLRERDVKVQYLHSNIETIERVEILKSLRSGTINVIVGINLLREGLDLPEVALVAILDADKIGFLRSHRALIQTSGRASRNVGGRVIMYADKMSDAMAHCIEETKRRRAIQEAHNTRYGIIPQTIIKPVEDILIRSERDKKRRIETPEINNRQEASALLKKLDFEMKTAADELDFEKAIALRNEIEKIKRVYKI